MLYLPMGTGCERIALYGAKRARHAFIHVGAAVVGDDAATARNQIDQATKRSLYRGEVVVDVGVVKLHMGQDQGIRKVVHELRTLIEKGGVVLVAFEDKGLSRTNMKAGAEIFR